MREREVALDEAERDLERSGRERARQFLLESRKRVEDALGIARAAVNEATAKEARRLVEDGVREEADALRRLDEVARQKGWRVSGSGASSPAAEPSPASVARYERAPDPLQTMAAEAVATEVDLRGMRVDEAEAALVSALDAAVVAELPSLRIIHGKGTGALRVAVQALLGRDRRVASHAFAVAHEGGTGVTIAELRR